MTQDNKVLQKVFGRSRVLLPVIHPTTKETALRSIETAVESGADGIFLINQGMSTSQILDFIPEVHQQYKNLWIGVNFLGTEPEEVIDLVVDLSVGGIWSDNAGIDERSATQPAGKRFRQARQRTGWTGFTSAELLSNISEKFLMPCYPMRPEMHSRGWMSLHPVVPGRATPQRLKRQRHYGPEPALHRWRWPVA